MDLRRNLLLSPEHFQIIQNNSELQHKSVMNCFLIFWEFAQVISKVALQKKHNAAAVALLSHGNLTRVGW